MNQFVFVHIPKTGGHFVMESLGFLPSENPLAWHHTFGDAIHPRKRNIQAEESFSMVRNPWERLVSVYFYCMKKHRKDHIICGRKKHDKFADWINCLKYEYGNKPPPKSAEEESDYFWLAPQYEWLFSESGRKVVKYIGKLEDHNNYFSHLRTKIPFCSNTLSLKKINKKNCSDHCHYSVYYKKSSTINFVENWYEIDISNFGYKFEYKHKFF